MTMSKKPTYEELEQRIQTLEKALNRSGVFEDEIEHIFNLSPDMIGYGKLDGYFTKINSAFNKTLGYSENEFYENPIFAFIHEDDVEKTTEALSKAQKGIRDIYVENRYKCKDGSYKSIEWHALAEVHENKFLAIGRDITERKQAEEVLREKDRFQEALLNDMLTFVGILEPNGNVIFINNTPLKVGGLELKNLKGKKFYDASWWTHSDKVRETIKHDVKQCAAGDSLRHDIQIRTADGSLMNMGPFNT